ncbi:MAG: hypothetical protein IKP47_05575 [Ruminococcus sp.]|nr:hypothetical protein [Ruminococcus sp.]
MGIVILGSVLVTLVIMTVFNFRRSQGSIHKAVKIGSIAAWVVFGLIAVFALVMHIKDSSDSKGHLRNGGGIFGGIQYIATENGYYVFRQSAFLSSSTIIAVPESAAELPKLLGAAIFDQVVIYTDGEPRYNEHTETSAGSARVWTNVQAINIEYILQTVFLALAAAAAAWLFELVMLIMTITDKRKTT